MNIKCVAVRMIIIVDRIIIHSMMRALGMGQGFLEVLILLQALLLLQPPPLLQAYRMDCTIRIH